MNNKRITRSNTECMIGGVCGGLAEYFNIDPTIIRLIVAFLALSSCGTVAVVYLIALLIIPKSDIL